MQGKATKILLVDDDQNLLTSLSDILTYKGFETLRAPTGGKALEIIADQAVEVALIDLRLEDTSGLELIHEVRISSPYTECILLTGYASQESAVEAIRYGAFGYFQKPFDIDQVILSIQQAVQKSQAAKSLAFNEQRLRALLENGRDNIVLFSAEGNLIWESSSVSVNWRYDFENIMEIGKSDLLHPLEKDLLSSSIQKIYSVPGSKKNVTFRLRDKTGSWRWVEGTAVNMLGDPAVQGVVINFRDITEQKAAEDQLRLHSHALNAAANAIVITDCDGLIQWVNPAFESMTGYSPQEVIGKNTRFLSSGVQDIKFYKNMWNTICSGVVWQGELVNKRKDGSLYTEEMTIAPLVDTDGKVVNFIAIKQDVTERKRFEETLSISESRYRSLFEESLVPILEEDFSAVKARINQLRRRGVKDWRRYLKKNPEVVREMAGLVKIIDVNKAAIQFHGASSKQDLHKNLALFFQDNPESKFLDELVCFAEGRMNFQVETVNRTYDGRIVHIIIYWSVAPGYENDLAKVIVSIVDITERKQREFEIEKQNRELNLLYTAGHALSRTLNLEEIYHSFYQQISSIMKCDTLYISELDRETEMITAKFAVAEGKPVDVSGFPPIPLEPEGHGIQSPVLRTGKARLVNDYMAELAKTNSNYFVSEEGEIIPEEEIPAGQPYTKSALVIPIMLNNQVQGAVQVQSCEKDAFSENDLFIAESIVSQISVAMNNAKLYQQSLEEIEARRNAETELRISRERLQSILDNTSALISIKDLEGRYILVNTAMTKAFGIKSEDMIGKPSHDVTTPEEADQYIKNCDAVLQMATPVTFEETHLQNDKIHTYLSVIFPLKDENGQTKAIGSISTDITEQKKNEDQLRLLSYAVEQSPASIVLTDPAGNVEYVNKSFTRMTGYTSEEILGKNIRILQSGHTTPEEYQTLWETVKAGKEWRGEFKNKTKNGETIWESSTITPILNSNQETKHYLEIKEDVSARKEAELALRRMNQELEDRVFQRTEELRSANTSLEKASRLKDEFLANMSHELRTPLTGVLGLSEALQKGVYGAVNEKQTSILNTIEEGGRHLLTLINDILDLSKIEAGKMELQPSIIRVDDICQSSLRMIKQIANSRHQKVTLTQNPPDMVMYGDPRRLKQILVNLLGNAVKFTPENGELGLEVEGDETLDVIWFSVWDKGIGITEENQQKLFQPFFQLESNLSRSYSGTGLGLSLVHRLAMLHGGQVKVTSKKGEGSRFTVSIPWYKDEATSLNEEAVKMIANRSKELEGKGRPVTPENILVIEDNDVNRGMISDFLSFQGYHVISAQSGQKGMDLLVKEKPDLVLMDIQMPGIDGFEVIRNIRQMQSAISKVPIIAVTALAMPEDRQLCLDAGADDYLSKPIDFSGLLVSIKNLKGKKK